MRTNGSAVDVLAIGEVMALMDAEGSGPLEDVRAFTLRAAGAEGNTLIALTRMGLRTALVSAVGDDPFGRLVRGTLDETGVDVAHVRVDPHAPTGVFFKERLDGWERRVYYYRAGSAASRLHLSDADVERLPHPRALVLSGLTLGLGGPDGLAGLARRLLRRLRGRSTVVFDANIRPHIWDQDRAAQEFAEILDDVDVVLAGRDEVRTLMPGRDPDEAARELCRSGVRAAVVKDGAQGAVAFDHTGATRIHPFPVQKVVDPVGAGDAFAAGVTSGLLEGRPIEDCARIGAVLGAAAVTVSGDWEALSTPTSPQQLLERYQHAVGADAANPARTETP